MGLPLVVPAAASVHHKAVESRLARQNAFFHQYYEWTIKNTPDQETSFGNDRYNDRLADVSLQGIAQQYGESDQFLRRLRSIFTEGMPEQDRMSHHLLLCPFVQADQSYALKEYEMPERWGSMRSPSITRSVVQGTHSRL